MWFQDKNMFLPVLTTTSLLLLLCLDGETLVTISSCVKCSMWLNTGIVSVCNSQLEVLFALGASNDLLVLFGSEANN